jgi:SAM-dependent methyltransferase
MAIPRPLAELICSEHAYRPLPPRVLLLGRQTMTFDKAQMAGLATRFGLALPRDIEIDTFTIHAKENPQHQFVSDTAFFRMLGAEIDAIDQSDFEGANIVADLCADIPDRLRGKFDFIVNGSVLDNVWDTAHAMRNISTLLADGGRLVSLESASSSRYSYSALSPSWYFDHFVVNRWADCRVYIAAVDGWPEVAYSSWPVLGFDPNAQERPNAFSPSYGDKLGLCALVAEKGIDSTHDVNPIQAHYRSDEDWQAFLQQVEPIRRSRRSLHMGTGGKGEAVAGYDGAWLSCGLWGQ